MADEPRQPNRRPVRVALVIAAVAAVVWATFLLGMVLTGRRELVRQPQPGQQVPAPEPGATPSGR